MTLNPVTVTDPMANLSAISCPDTQLAAGDNETCSATYTTTSTDVTNGSIVNTGTATGTPPTGPTVTDQSQVTVPYAAASITIAKSASIASYSASNVPVTYHYLVTNTGNVTLNRGHGHRPDGEPLGDQLPGHPAGRRATTRPAAPPTRPRRPT